MRARYVNGAAFIILLAVWTWKLVEPNPVPAVLEQEIPSDWRYWLSKLVHVGMYAVLTVSGTVCLCRRAVIWGVISLLLLHAVATEIAQTYVPNRHGCVRDVVLDWIGIGLGLVAVRWLMPRLRHRRNEC